MCIIIYTYSIKFTKTLYFSWLYDETAQFLHIYLQTELFINISLNFLHSCWSFCLSHVNSCVFVCVQGFWTTRTSARWCRARAWWRFAPRGGRRVEVCGCWRTGSPCGASPPRAARRPNPSRRVSLTETFMAGSIQIKTCCFSRFLSLLFKSDPRSLKKC